MVSGAKLIDFSRGNSSPLIEFTAHKRVGDVSISRCSLAPNPGLILGSQQLVIATHVGEPYELVTGQGNFRKAQTIRSGMMNVWPANTPVYLAWDIAAPRIDVIAIEHQMVSRILHNAGLSGSLSPSAKFGVRDKTMSQLAKTCHDEIGKTAAGDRSFTEGLSIALVTHVYRSYGENAAADLVKGGLTPLDAQRVISYIEQNLHENIGLEHLASTVKLSTHYFTEAFRKTVGVPPYRYLLTKRIERAKALLLNSDMAPGKIAAEVGFSSQAQFTTNFRKMVGKTPGRFRREAT